VSHARAREGSPESRRNARSRGKERPCLVTEDIFQEWILTSRGRKGEARARARGSRIQFIVLDRSMNCESTFFPSFSRENVTSRSPGYLVSFLFTLEKNSLRRARYPRFLGDYYVARDAPRRKTLRRQTVSKVAFISPVSSNRAITSSDYRFEKLSADWIAVSSLDSIDRRYINFI